MNGFCIERLFCVEVTMSIGSKILVFLFIVQITN